jgi:hypothetical protein
MAQRQRCRSRSRLLFFTFSSGAMSTHATRHRSSPQLEHETNASHLHSFLKPNLSSHECVAAIGPPLPTPPRASLCCCSFRLRTGMLGGLRHCRLLAGSSQAASGAFAEPSATRERGPQPTYRELPHVRTQCQSGTQTRSHRVRTSLRLRRSSSRMSRLRMTLVRTELADRPSVPPTASQPAGGRHV